jgi:hypothetical protein
VKSGNSGSGQVELEQREGKVSGRANYVGYQSPQSGVVNGTVSGAVLFLTQPDPMELKVAGDEIKGHVSHRMGPGRFDSLAQQIRD